MGADDTPHDAIPARRLGEHGAVVSVVELLETFRLEVGNAFRDLRKEAAQASRDIQQRLSGIEGRLAEGSATIDKHDGQIVELASAAAELTRRVGAVESKLARREAKEEEVREAARVAAKDRRNALSKRAVSAFVVGAAGAVGTLAVGVLVWLLVAWGRLGAPGATVPGMTPAAMAPANEEPHAAADPAGRGTR